MALNYIPGATVAITVGSTTFEFFAISLNSGKALINVSHFGNLFECYIGGLKRCSGQISAYVQGGSGTGNENPFQDMDNLTLLVTFASGDTYSFSAILGERVISTDVNGAVIATFQFVKTGESAPVTTWS